MTANSVFLVNNAYGIYVPQIFAKNFIHVIANRSDMDTYLDDLLYGPDNELYWESWDMLLDNAKLKFGDKVYELHQNDGDLWAVPVDELDQISDSEFEGLANYANED